MQKQDVMPDRFCVIDQAELYARTATGLVKRQLHVFAITRRNGNSIDVEYSNSERLQIGCYRADVNNTLLFFKSLFKNVPQAFNQFSSKTSFPVSITHQPFTCFALLAKKNNCQAAALYFSFAEP
jgi:hypothetical protein